MPESMKNKALFLLQNIIGLLAIISFIGFTWNGFGYAVSIVTLYLLYLFAHKCYNENLYISTICHINIFFMLFLTILVYKLDVYPTILQHNKMATLYIADGTLLKVSTTGYLTFLLAQYLVFRVRHTYNAKSVNLLVDSAQSLNRSTDISRFRILAKYLLLLPVAIWITITVFGKSIIWLYPHMSKGVEIPYFTPLIVFTNFVTPVVMNFALISNIKVKTLIFYSIILSVLALSSGSRAGCIIPLVSMVLLLKSHKTFSMSFRSILFILVPAGGTIISFLGRLRFEIAENSLVNIISSFVEDIRMGGIIEYIFCGIPVLGQNLAHYSAYIYLYDTGQHSTIMPYLNGIINILPRDVGLRLGLPVNPFDVHAWQLREFGIISTGGSYLFGEPYWLGGLPAIMIFSFFFGFITMLLDLRFGKRKFIGHYLGGCILLSMGIGYGFSGWMRAFYLLLFSDIIVKFIKKKHFQHRLDH